MEHGGGQGEREMKTRADARFGLDLDLAAEQLRVAAGDGEAESGAAKAAAGDGLVEGREESGAFVGSEADAGVDDVEAPLFARLFGEADDDFAARGEFDIAVGGVPACVAGASPSGFGAVALEPETHAPDGLRRLLRGEPDGLAWLAPGRTLRMSIDIAIATVDERA
jgi:hypothetical protein